MNTRKVLDEAARAAEIVALVQAPRGICRFCGCTLEHPCQPPCGWLDPHHSICTAPACLARYTALEMPALRALVSNKCACEKVKSRRWALCTGCWHALPWVLSSLLYTRMDRGFACYYDEALAALKLLGRAPDANGSVTPLAAPEAAER